jgi:molybdate transport repressor ModE-like protein
MSELARVIELKQLLALRAVAQTGTFWQAAEQVHTSHSTLSDHIASLEALTGQRLVERSRGRRSVRLTEAGTLLVGHAIAIEARLEAAEADLRALAHGEAGSVRVGIYQSLAHRMLPRLMREFSAGWPRVELHVQEVLDDPHLITGIERGELDVCFDIQPIPPGPFATRELLHDPYVLVCAADSPLGGRQLSAADLAHLPLVAYLPSRTFDVVERYLEAAGVRPRIIYRSNDNASVQAMVAAGLGVAIMPRLAVDPGGPRLRLLKLTDPVPPRVIVAVSHRDRTEKPSTRAVVEIAAAVLTDVPTLS